MKKHCRILFLLSMLLASNSTWAQSDSSLLKLKNYVQNISQFNRLYPQEKVYIHFDNTAYYLGETIWFKAYVVNASSHIQTDVSKILYVELLNSRGKVLETKKLEIIGGQCHNGFYLTSFNYDYYPGYYELRAYTKNMLNFGTETVFSRVFPVFNEPENPGEYTSMDLKEGRDAKRLKLPQERTKPKKQKGINMDFYPEGGNLVQGIPNRIAFKLTNENGQGIDADGAVLSEKKDTLIRLKTEHNGMGIFEYTPTNDKAKVSVWYQNRTYSFALPEFLANGYSMQVNALSQRNLLIQIEQSEHQPNTPLGLTVMCRGELSHFLTLNQETYPYTLRIDKTELTTGINQITLFDSQGMIYAERLVFIMPSIPTENHIEIKSNKKKYSWRQKISLDIEAEPNMSLSLSVRDAATTPKTADVGNILSNLLLSSDLKGCIEEPAYYFSATDTQHRHALDLLMLVQGWRRYSWRDMSGASTFKLKYTPEKKLMIVGHLGAKKKDLSDAEVVNLEIEADGKYLTGIAPLDSLHRFSIPIDTTLYGEHYMLLSSKGLKKANTNIRLDRWFSPSPKTYSFYETLNMPEEDDSTENSDSTILESSIKDEKAFTAEIESTNDSIQMYYKMREVSVNEKRGKDLIYNVEQDRDRLIDLGKLYAVDAFGYLVEKDNGFLYKSFVQEIPDNVAGSSGSATWGRKYHRLVCRYMVDERNWKKIAVDNRFPTLLGNKVLYILMEQIKKMVIREWQSEGAYSPHLKIILTMNPCYLYPYDNTVYSILRKDANFRVTTFDGYSELKDFYTGRPERENYLPEKSDYNRTLYWNPNIRTDAKGHAQVSFYNNAWCNEIEISAEGITETGKAMTNEQLNRAR